MGAPSSSQHPRPRAVAVVPARLASQRLPRKMLLAETGLLAGRAVTLTGWIELQWLAFGLMLAMLVMLVVVGRPVGAQRT